MLGGDAWLTISPFSVLAIQCDFKSHCIARLNIVLYNEGEDKLVEKLGDQDI